MTRKFVQSDAQLDDLPLFRQNVEQDEVELDDDDTVDGGGEEVYDDAELYDEQVEAFDQEGFDQDHAGPDAGDLVESFAMPRTAGMFWILGGAALLLLGALGMAAAMFDVRELQRPIELLGRTSVRPVHVAMGGFLLVLFGFHRRRHVASYARLMFVEQLVGDLHDTAAVIASNSRFLRHAEQNRADRATSGEDLGQVLMILQRYEEKINNLTIATKMYGKPLLEITNQLADAAHSLSENQSMIGSLRDDAEKSTERLEQTIQRELEKLGACDSGQDEMLRRRLDGLETDLEAKLAGHGRQVRETLEAMSTTLQNRLTELHNAQGKGKAGNLEQSLADVRRQLEMLSTSVDDLRRNGLVASGSGATTVAASSSAASDGGKGGIGIGNSGLAHSIAGERPAGGDTLGAIAKLKKMRK